MCFKALFKRARTKRADCTTIRSDYNCSKLKIN